MSAERRFGSEKIVSLTHHPDGLAGTVVDVVGNAELQGRLMGMGLFVGTRFELLRKGSTRSNKPFLLAIGETRIAVDYRIAKMIFVEP